MAKEWKHIGNNSDNQYEGLTSKEKFCLKKKQAKKDLFDIMRIRRMPVNKPKKTAILETENE